MANTIWLMGLSGAGKTTLANELKKSLNDYVLIDGDELRKSLCIDLGFSDIDRTENIRRAVAVCKLLNDQGVNAIATLMTPTHAQQQLVLDALKLNVFMVYVNADIKTCIYRNTKGLYSDRTRNVVGLDLPFDIPNSHFKVDTVNNNVKHCCALIFSAFLNFRTLQNKS